MLCKFCNKSCKNENSHRNHERLCPVNPSKHISGFSKYKKENPISWNAGLKGKNDPRCAHKLSTKEALRGSTGKGATEAKEIERVDKIREKIIKRYADGWEPTCGRCKKYEYDSPMAGKIKVDGSWELLVAQHLDKLGVKWKRNRERFVYIKPDGRKSTYQPDFYIEDWKSF